MSEICIFATADEMYENAAEKIVRAAATYISRQGSFNIALSGGTTPTALYKLLATSSYRKRVDWSKCFFYWGDERLVDEGMRENNAHAAIEDLLSKVPIPVENIFRIHTRGTAEAAADAYEKTINNMLGKDKHFDLVLLGLGTNGHTASLFPGTDILDEQKRKVKSVYVKEANQYRISLTAWFINKTSEVIFLVSGAGKSNVVKEVLDPNTANTSLPARLINPQPGTLYWYLDAAAAGQLKK